MITPQAAYAWQRGDLHACHQALGIYPFQWSPFRVDGAEPPEYVANKTGEAMSAESWARAWALRRALIKEAGPPGQHDRHGRPLGVVLPPSERRRR